MHKFHRPAVLQLADGEFVHFDQPCLVRVVQGRVWITHAQSPDDHFLDAGQALALPAGAHALLGAEGPAHVTVQRLSRSEATAPGATIAGWTSPRTS